LTRQGLTLYPRSEDLWAMLALLHEVAHEWQQAAECIEYLLDIQGNNAPAETWGHWVRVLRCLGDDQRAFEAVQQGLQSHPLDSMLTSEYATLEALLNLSALRSAA
jgi:tetratricopeptide (TPR) repeat protein